MNTLIVAAIISVATADISTTTTIIDRNNSESTHIKNFTGSTVKVSILTTEKSELGNTTESTNVLLSRKNGTITRQGKITEVQNTSTAVQYRNHQISNEDRNDTKREENNQLQIEFITKPPETRRNVLKNIFEKILSYKNIHLEKDYNEDEKDKIIKAYVLFVSQKYKRKWVPKNLGLKLFSVKNMTLKSRPTIKRQKRSIKEDAGFTHDSETCKQYNNNLLIMWSNLSKYISTSEKSPPNKSVLHNIGVMIKAYLDHVTPIEIKTETEAEKLIVRKERNISTILSSIVNEIKTKMDRKEINEVNTLTTFILDQVTHFRIDNINEECNKIIQNQIAKLINIAFKKYLLYTNCNNLYKNANNNGNDNVLNNTPLNQKIYNNLQSLKIPHIDESRFDQNLLKVVKRSPVETTNIINTSTQAINLSSETAVNNSNSNNLITNETIDISNENRLKDSVQDKEVQSRRAKLNGKLCADLALDQFILTVKLILRLYLLNDDCTSGAYKFTIISKLIEATPILEPFNGNNLDYLSQYHVLLRLLDNMETKEMSNLFTPKAEVQNKNTLEQFLHDINNLGISMNYKQNENNKISNNDIKYQQLLNSLYNYQQLNNNDKLIKSKNTILDSVNAEDNPILTIGNNRVNGNVKELQGMYTDVPINQNFEANRSIIYEYLTNKTYDKPITIGSTINSGNINYSKKFIGTSDSKSEIFPNLFSATGKDYSNINPMLYNLMMNYSGTYPTNIKENYASLGILGVFPPNLFNSTLTNMNPFKNTLLKQNSASNPDTLSNYFSKFAKIYNSPENQVKNSPSVPNNGVLLNLFNNNRAMLNNNFNTKSEVTVNEANLSTYLRNPALEQHNLNIPSNFGVNSGVSYYNQINNMNSNLIKNDNDLLRDNNLNRDKNPFNYNFNKFNLMKPNILRSNPNFNDIKNSLQPNGNLFLRNSYLLRTSNVPQIQKTPIIYRTDLNPTSFNGLFVNNPSLNVKNSSYIRNQPIQTLKISGVPLKNIQSVEKPKQNLSKSLFINPYSKTLINKDNELNNYLNSAATPFLRNNLRTYDKKLESSTSPIISIDSLPTISSDPDANGDVELTYVFHHPQIVVYQPQVLVKRRISYIDYINNFNKIFNNQKKTQQLHLYKIIRYLPHNNVQVLYQSDSIFPILKIENTTSSN